MNKNAILRVAEAIDRHEISTLGFNMASYCGTAEADRSGHGCGTVACLAGWTVALFRRDGTLRSRPMRPSELFSFAKKTTPLSLNSVAHDHAREALGLRHDQAEDLFCPHLDGLDDGGLSGVSPLQVTATLRRLVRTGKIEWL